MYSRATQPASSPRRRSIVVCSGNGVHLYWILTEPFAIDDVEPPPAVLIDWINQGPNQKRHARKYIQSENGQRIYLHLHNGRSPNSDCPWGELSAKARLVKDVLAGLAAKIGVDHTKDLARCLRLPGTLNRKDERNGRLPVPCELVECDPERRYPFTAFETLAASAVGGADNSSGPAISNSSGTPGEPAQPRSEGSPRCEGTTERVYPNWTSPEAPPTPPMPCAEPSLDAYTAVDIESHNGDETPPNQESGAVEQNGVSLQDQLVRERLLQLTSGLPGRRSRPLAL